MSTDPNVDDEFEEQLRNNHQRLLSVSEHEIGDTIYTVRSIVPENVTDEQFQESTKEKIKRLIINEVERSIRNGEL